MRSFSEVTCKNLLRRPLVLGVPFSGLLILSVLVVGVQALLQGSKIATLLSLLCGGVGYIALRLATRFLKQGFEEILVFAIENLSWKLGNLRKLSLYCVAFTSRKLSGKKALKISQAKSIPNQFILINPSEVEVVSPDTLDENELIQIKENLSDKFLNLNKKERLTFLCDVTSEGASLFEIKVNKAATLGISELLRDVKATKSNGKEALSTITEDTVKDCAQIYSLYNLPVKTDPLWLFSILKKIPPPFKVIASFKACQPPKYGQFTLRLHFAEFHLF